MDRQRFEKQLRLDEGVRFVVYHDTRDILTVGIGHKVLNDDNLVLGQRITGEQIRTFLAQDIDTAIAACEQLFPEWETFHETVQEVLVNMCFNLGATGLGKFRKMRTPLEVHDYATAADEMTDSTWYTQVGQRAKRLVTRMRSAQVTQA